jgi:hypothetical protein
MSSVSKFHQKNENFGAKTKKKSKFVSPFFDKKREIWKKNFLSSFASLTLRDISTCGFRMAKNAQRCVLF